MPTSNERKMLSSNEALEELMVGCQTLNQHCINIPCSLGKFLHRHAVKYCSLREINGIKIIYFPTVGLGRLFRGTIILSAHVVVSISQWPCSGTNRAMAQLGI